jgi:hypothetical protein
MAKIHHQGDGDVSAERFVAALTEFSSRRPADLRVTLARLAALESAGGSE